MTNAALYLPYIVLAILLISATVTDWKHRKIYNKTTVPAFIIGLLLAIVSGVPGLVTSVLTASAIAFGVFFVLFFFGLMGGGDVKLMTAVAVLTGYPLILDIMLWGILAGGLYSILYVAISGQLGSYMRRVAGMLYSLFIWKTLNTDQNASTSDLAKIPYGVCISAGTFIAIMLHHSPYPPLVNVLFGNAG